MIFAVFYNLLLVLFFPAILYMLYWPKKGKIGFGRRWIEHFGWVPKATKPYDLWVHAVSVGESNAAVPIINALLKQQPELHILVTTTTATGYERIKTQLAQKVTHHYCPVDLLPCIELFLCRTQARCLMIMETELWPNLLSSCRRRHIPVILANARMSQRSANRYAKLGRLSQWLFQHLNSVLAQYPSDAEHFAALGTKPQQIHVTGSVKFDITPDSNLQIAGQTLRQQLGACRPVIIAASTRDDEEAIVLEAYTQLLQSHPSTLLILVPRHPQRFEQVSQLCKHNGFSTARRSKEEAVTHSTQIYLGDTMGELTRLYAASDIAFIGGSLVPMGGQNMLEPAALGKPCLMGTSVYNFTDIANKLVEHNALKLCENHDELAHSFKTLLSDHELRQKMGNAARTVVTDNRGAVAKTVAQLQVYLT